MTSVATSPEADVIVGGDGDRLLVVSRRPERVRDVRRLLREAGVPFRAMAGGAVIPAAAAGALAAVADVLPLSWDDASRTFAENRRALRRRHATVRETVRAVVDAGPDEARQALAAVPHAGRLDDHQAINVVAATRPEVYGLCIFDEQGTGKTVTGLFAAHVLFQGDEVDLALVVAPKSMVAEWKRDLDVFLPDFYSCALLDGTPREKRAILSSPPDVLVCNFEAVVSWSDEITAAVRAQRGRSVLLVDESFMVKNLDAQRTRSLRAVRELAGRCVVLCGTPAPNSASDLVGQFNLADFGATFGDVHVPDDRQAAHALVATVLDDRGVYLRNLKEVVLPHLPTRLVHEVPITLAPIQAAAYRAAERNLILDLEAMDDEGFSRQFASFAARRAALLQLCSHPGAILERYSELPAKLDALDRLVRDLVDSGEKVVVWSYFRHSLTAIAGQLADLGLVRYDGSVAAMSDRREAVRRFQEDDDCSVFVANPAAAGAGLTLHAARYAIYESMSNQAAHYMQSLDRIHRRGQERPVEYLFLVSDGTIEQTEFTRLRAKERAARDLLGDPGEPPPTRLSMLTQLMAAQASSPE